MFLKKLRKTHSNEFMFMPSAPTLISKLLCFISDDDKCDRVTK